MRIEQIIREKQPEQYMKLKRRRRHRHHKKYDNQFSFNNIDRLMRERTDIDERQCRGK